MVIILEVNSLCISLHSEMKHPFIKYANQKYQRLHIGLFVNLGIFTKHRQDNLNFVIDLRMYPTPGMVVSSTLFEQH